MGFAFGLNDEKTSKYQQQFVGRAFPASCSSSQLGSQISTAMVPCTAAVPVDEIAAAVAQAMGSVLQGVLSSLQSNSTAISSSSLPAASAWSHCSDLPVPEHSR